MWSDLVKCRKINHNEINRKAVTMIPLGRQHSHAACLSLTYKNRRAEAQSSQCWTGEAASPTHHSTHESVRHKEDVGPQDDPVLPQQPTSILKEIWGQALYY